MHVILDCQAHFASDRINVVEMQRYTASDLMKELNKRCDLSNTRNRIYDAINIVPKVLFRCIRPKADINETDRRKTHIAFTDECKWKIITSITILFAFVP